MVWCWFAEIQMTDVYNVHLFMTTNKHLHNLHLLIQYIYPLLFFHVKINKKIIKINYYLIIYCILLLYYSTLQDIVYKTIKFLTYEQKGTCTNDFSLWITRWHLQPFNEIWYLPESTKLCIQKLITSHNNNVYETR